MASYNLASKIHGHAKSMFKKAFEAKYWKYIRRTPPTSLGNLSTQFTKKKHTINTCFKGRGCGDVWKMPCLPTSIQFLFWYFGPGVPISRCLHLFLRRCSVPNAGRIAKLDAPAQADAGHLQEEVEGQGHYAADHHKKGKHQGVTSTWATPSFFWAGKRIIVSRIDGIIWGSSAVMDDSYMFIPPVSSNFTSFEMWALPSRSIWDGGWYQQNHEVITPQQREWPSTQAKHCHIQEENHLPPADIHIYFRDSMLHFRRPRWA